MIISASQVKELRELTGAGMMDCKIALTETSGDTEAAIDWLRKKGIAKADKKSGRIAAEGLIGVTNLEKEAVLVEVNSETDFVARNEIFQDLVRNISQVALHVNGALPELLAADYPNSNKSVSETLLDTVATIGENLSVRRFVRLTVPFGVVATYTHNNVGDGLGKMGVLVSIETDGDKEAALNFGRQVAMHIAAINPLAVTESEVDGKEIERERAIFMDQARASGKPESIIEKMIEGRMRKFFGEVVLLSQPFVLDPNMTVQEALKDAEKEIGAPAKIVAFRRFVLGEGLVKEDDTTISA